MKHRSTTTLLLVMALLLLAPGALAAQGWIMGTLKFDSQQGNYCSTAAPYSMDCTASRFPASIAVGMQPIRDSEIRLLDPAGNQVGLGATDRNGVFIIKWIATTVPAKITVRWVLRHYQSRFSVVDNNDAIYAGDFTNVSPIVNQTVDIGPMGWSYTEPNNIYDGAQRTWYEAMNYSGLLVGAFTNVRLRWPSNNAAVGAAQADSPNKLVHLGTSTAKAPQGRVSHEMGHLASYMGTPTSACVAYNYPNACTNVAPSACGGIWGFETSEYYCAGFEEAMASYISDVSYYWYWATTPTTCSANTPCNMGSFLESSMGTGCTAVERHRVVNAERYLWDAYDSVDDANYDESVSMSYFDVVGSLTEFPSGIGNGQNNEAWKTVALTTIDDPEGRSANDFRLYLGANANSTLTQYNQNCAPGP